MSTVVFLSHSFCDFMWFFIPNLVFMSHFWIEKNIKKAFILGGQSHKDNKHSVSIAEAIHVPY